jgi:hypothetical protein
MIDTNQSKKLSSLWEEAQMLQVPGLHKVTRITKHNSKGSASGAESKSTGTNTQWIPGKLSSLWKERTQERKLLPLAEK